MPPHATSACLTFEASFLLSLFSYSFTTWNSLNWMHSSVLCLIGTYKDCRWLHTQVHKDFHRCSIDFHCVKAPQAAEASKILRDCRHRCVLHSVTHVCGDSNGFINSEALAPFTTLLLMARSRLQWLSRTADGTCYCTFCFANTREFDEVVPDVSGNSVS